jgi:protein required for attachment to host cells
MVTGIFFIEISDVRKSVNMSVCVVVASSSKAKVLIAEDGHSPLVESAVYDHPQSRLREQDLVSDGSGSATDSGGFGKHSMGHEQAARHKQAGLFAQEIGAEIDKLRRKTNLRRIYLVAPPKFLGLLRGSISKQCLELLHGEVNKDLVTHSIEDIRSHLPKLL